VTNLTEQIEGELKGDRELAKLTNQEELILDVAELILQKMEYKGISKSHLAKLLDTNKSHVTQLLRGSRNMTLRTVSDMFFELGCKIIVDAIPNDECCRKFAMKESKLFLRIDHHVTDWTPPKQLNEYMKFELVAAA
jgi:ribosome-binding protein aMBF1 (putative translation factor)